jgi:hypothetical protein
MTSKLKFGTFCNGSDFEKWAVLRIIKGIENFRSIVSGNSNNNHQALGFSGCFLAPQEEALMLSVLHLVV